MFARTYLSLSFSKNLIEETIRSFEEEEGILLSEETANEYLNSLSELFLMFVDIPRKSLESEGKVNSPSEVVGGNVPALTPTGGAGTSDQTPPADTVTPAERCVLHHDRHD